MTNPSTATAAVTAMLARHRKLKEAAQWVHRHHGPKGRKQCRRSKKAWRRVRASERRIRNLYRALAGQGADPLLLPMHWTFAWEVGKTWHAYNEAVTAYLEDPDSENAADAATAFHRRRAWAIRDGVLPDMLPTFDPSLGRERVRAAHARYVERAAASDADPQLPF